MKNKFLINRIWFIGLDKILENYVSEYPIFSQTSKSIHRIDPIKPILVNGLDYPYEFDLNYLNNDMAEVFDTKYILSIIVVFSLKGMIYNVNK